MAGLSRGSSDALCASAEERLLLLRPLPQSLDVLVVAFTVYHGVKLGHAAAVAKAQRTSDFDEVVVLMARIAKAQAIKSALYGKSRPRVAPERPLWEKSPPTNVKHETLEMT